MTVAHPRTAARRRALDLLFSADVRHERAAELLVSEQRVDKTARAIVEGVEENRDEIDATIARYAEHWALDRMPAVDRNLLRIGVYEIRYADGVPPGAAINDLVELAKTLSTEDSGRFVNALLGRVLRG